MFILWIFGCCCRRENDGNSEFRRFFYKLILLPYQECCNHIVLNSQICHLKKSVTKHKMKQAQHIAAMNSSHQITRPEFSFPTFYFLIPIVSVGKKTKILFVRCHSYKMLKRAVRDFIFPWEYMNIYRLRCRWKEPLFS